MNKSDDTYIGIPATHFHDKLSSCRHVRCDDTSEEKSGCAMGSRVKKLNSTRGNHIHSHGFTPRFKHTIPFVRAINQYCMHQLWCTVSVRSRRRTRSPPQHRPSQVHWRPRGTHSANKTMHNKKVPGLHVTGVESSSQTSPSYFGVPSYAHSH